MANSYGQGQVNLTLTMADLYFGVVGLGILAAVLGFVTHTVPSWAGWAGAGAAVTVIFGYLVDQFVPASAWEYIAVTIVSALVGVAGSLSGVQNISLVAVLIWITAFLAAVYNSATENGGSFLNSQQSTLFIGITGAGLAFFTWWAGDPTATLATVITTLVTTVGQFLRVSVKAAARALAAARAGAAKPPGAPT